MINYSEFSQEYHSKKSNFFIAHIIIPNQLKISIPRKWNSLKSKR